MIGSPSLRNNGDGVRVAKTTGAATTEYVLDLASTLPVVISDTDMQIIYGAFIAGIGSWETVEEYQSDSVPGDLGRRIAPFLLWYRQKLEHEKGL